MSNKCPTCSQSGTERSNPQSEAQKGEPMSRNANELDSASLRNVGAANLPKMLKPEIVGQVTLERSRRAPRGGWRQRVGKEKHRNLGDPVWVITPHRKSEGIVVVKKQGNSCGAKGSYCKSETIDHIHFRLPLATTEKRCVWMIESESATMNACRKAGCGKSARPV